MGLRDQKKEAMRGRLYETAMAMFRDQGFLETRIRDVIDRRRGVGGNVLQLLPDEGSGAPTVVHGDEALLRRGTSATSSPATPSRPLTGCTSWR